MKNIIQGLLFWTSFILLIIVASAIVNIMSEIITMNMIMTAAYIALGLGLIYLIKN